MKYLIRFLEYLTATKHRKTLMSFIIKQYQAHIMGAFELKTEIIRVKKGNIKYELVVFENDRKHIFKLKRHHGEVAGILN